QEFRVVLHKVIERIIPFFFARPPANYGEPKLGRVLTALFKVVRPPRAALANLGKLRRSTAADAEHLLRDVSQHAIVRRRPKGPFSAGLQLDLRVFSPERPKPLSCRQHTPQLLNRNRDGHLERLPFQRAAHGSDRYFSVYPALRLRIQGLAPIGALY